MVAADGGLDDGLVADLLDDLALEQIDQADEFGHQAAVGKLVDPGGGVHLDDLTGVHHRDAGGHGHGLLLVVGHGDEGDPDAFLEVDQLELGRLAQPLVQGPQGLVQEQELGVLGQAAGQGDALALPAGELVRAALAQRGDLEQFEHVPDALGALGPGHLLLLEPELHVLLHRHVGEQGVGLEHHVDRAGVGRDLRHVHPVDEDAPCGRPLQPGEHAQQGGLAAPGAPQEGEEFPLEDVEADVVHRIDVTELLGDACRCAHRASPWGPAKARGGGDRGDRPWASSPAGLARWSDAVIACVMAVTL